MALWLVRAGSSGEHELEALKYDIATIGWNEIPDVSKIKDKEELKELYLRYNPGTEKKRTSRMVGQIWDFAKEIQKGDMIALPLKSHSLIVLGTVKGNYEFKEISPTIKHTRPVKWLKIVPREQFDQDLLYSLGAFSTVCQIERHNAEDKIRYLIENIDKGMTVKGELKTILEDYGLLKKDVSKTHLDILEKFHKKRGKYLPPSEIYGEKKYRGIRKSPLPPDEIVNAPHYMHNLITGVYTPSGDDYALSIQLNPKSRWELEIDRNFPTLRINYDFGPNPAYKSQTSKLENCYRNDIPIGIIFKTGKSKNKVLGLGKISSFDDTRFVIDSYGISEEESRLLKEETIREFDKSIADPEFSKIENINYTEFLSTIDINDEKFKGNLLIRSPEARRIKINQIIDYCDSGEWVIPRFQRYFDWKKEDVRDFLKSIFLDYYVGALLLWDVRKETELDIMPVYGVNPNQGLKENAIVLDGQQRITSLYYAIKAPDFPLAGDSKRQPSYFYIDFSEFLKSEDSDDLIKIFYEKIENGESFKKMLFPFYNLEKYYDWTSGLEAYLRKQDDIDQQKIPYLRRLIDDKLRYIYNGFEIAYVTLSGDRTLDQVTEIFEKINSSGIQLDVFDLLIARLSKYKIKLRDLWDEYERIQKSNNMMKQLDLIRCPFTFYSQWHYVIVNPSHVRERIS